MRMKLVACEKRKYLVLSGLSVWKEGAFFFDDEKANTRISIAFPPEIVRANNATQKSYEQKPKRVTDYLLPALSDPELSFKSLGDTLHVVDIWLGL